MALGKGAAFGVDLWTKASVELTDEPNIIKGEITSDPAENTILIEKTVAQVLKHFHMEKQAGAKVKTWSNIPIARGLKSSSAAANAVALATVKALDKKIDDLTIIDLGVSAAFEAKVTVTGAYDDACASYFGGLLITDNAKRRIIKKCKLPEGLTVLFHVPPKKSYTGAANMKKLKTVKPLVKGIYREARRGDFWAALTLNGFVYSAALGLDSAIAVDALEAGALAVGLCGKGPAVTAVAPCEGVDSVEAALKSYEGEVLHANFNSEKATVI
jgi:shikimate kinase